MHQKEAKKPQVPLSLFWANCQVEQGYKGKNIFLTSTVLSLFLKREIWLLLFLQVESPGGLSDKELSYFSF